MATETVLQPLNPWGECRCCGKPGFFTDSPIHTECIPRHWRKHYRGVNNTRCREFGVNRKGNK